jgi:hypothetical protein
MSGRPKADIPGTWIRRCYSSEGFSGKVSALAAQPQYLRHEVAPCNHLGLFMGKRTLEEYWPRIVRWMKEVD